MLKPQELFITAIKNNDTELILHLLKSKEVDPTVKDNWVVIEACRYCDEKVVAALLEDKRIDPTVLGNIALEWAIVNNRPNIVNMLLMDYRIDYVDIKKSRIVQYALKNGTTEAELVLKTLLTKYISDITVIGYKCLDNVDIPLFKRVNIITGRNNIGKTALLESIFCALEATNETTIPKAYVNLNSINGTADDLCISRTIGTSKQKVIDLPKSMLTARSTEFNKHEIVIGKDGCYVGSDCGNDINTIEQLTATIFTKCNNDIQCSYLASEEIQKALSEAPLMNPYGRGSFRTGEFASIVDKMRLVFNGTYGKSGLKIMAIVLAIINSENGVVCIDDIDKGIHPSLLINVMRYIINIAQDFNCQLFITINSPYTLVATETVLIMNNDVTITTLSYHPRDKRLYVHHGMGHMEFVKYLLDSSDNLEKLVDKLALI